MISGNEIVPVANLRNVLNMHYIFITLKIDILTPSLDFNFIPGVPVIHFYTRCIFIFVYI